MRTALRRTLGAGLSATLAASGVIALAGSASAATNGVLVYGLTATGAVTQFRAEAPGTLLATSPTVRLASGEQLVALDVRPATGELFGLVNGTSMDRLVVLDPATGAITRSAALVPGPTTATFAQLDGSEFAFDFNPVIDRIRVVTDTNDNYVLNPDSGQVQAKQNDVFRAGDATDPDVRGAAYTNNVARPTTTALYDIDIAGADAVYTQVAAAINGDATVIGRLDEVGDTGTDVATATATTGGSPSVGFDVEAVTNIAYAVLQDGPLTAEDALYRVNLTTGAATEVASAGGIGGASVRIVDIAVASPRYSLAPTASGSEGFPATITVTRTGDAADAATVTLATAPGSAGAGDFGAPAPVTFAAGQTTATTTVPLLQDGAAEPSETFTVSISGATGPAGNDAGTRASTVVTITETQGRFHPVVPARILDTRRGADTPVAAGSDRALTVTGVGGVPEGATAVVLNVTAVGSTAKSNLQVFPAGSKPARRTSNLNFPVGLAVPVQVQTGVGTDGQVVLSNAVGLVDVVVDVFGYYGGASDALESSSGYTALSPRRALDTRTNRAPVRAGNDRVVRINGLFGVPDDATAVALNTTVLGTTSSIDVQVYATGDRPAERTSNLNVRPGEVKANAVTVGLGTNNSVSLSVSAGQADVVLDVVGYYSQGSAARFVPLTPARILDTRTAPSDPLVAGADRSVTVAGSASGIPADASAAVLSVTVTEATLAADLQVFPTGDRPARRTSTTNVRPGEQVANLAATALGTGGEVSLSLSRGSSAVILDALGYFTD